MMVGLRTILGRLSRDTEGAAAIEFAILAPITLAIVFSIMESGWIMSQSIMLDRGVSKGVRSIQLGHPTSYEKLKQDICQESYILSDCTDAVRLEFTPLNTTNDFPSDTTPCRDQNVTIDPVKTFDAGQRSQIMFVRACFVVDPIVPGIGFALHYPKEANGKLRLTSSFAFVNEPG